MRAELYIAVAQRAFEEMQANSDPLALVDANSPRLQSAVTCTIFSAFAVEEALLTLIWIRCFFQTPLRYRALAIQHAERLRRAPLEGKLEFVRGSIKMDASLLVDIAKLFQSRDRLAHPQIQRVEDWQLDEDAVEALNEQGRGAEVDYAMELSLKGLSGTQRVYEVVAAR